MSIPLICHYQPDALLLTDGQQQWSQAQFLYAALALAAQLPPQASHVLPLGSNKLSFMLAFAAALIANRPCLLPPAGHPAALAQLRAAYPQAMVISELPERCTTAADLCLRPQPGAAALGLPPSIPAQQLAAIAYTSGSTGSPQAQAKSWQCLVATAECAAQRLGRAAHIVATVPPQHMYGLETTVMMALVARCTLHSGIAFFAEDVRAALAALSAPRMLVTTPIHLRALVAAAPALPPLALMLSATAPLPEALAAAAEQQFHAPLYEIYGCTEAGSLATRRPTRHREWQLYPGLQLTVDGDNHLLHAPYLPAPVPLADSVQVLPEGRFLLLGRSSELIKVGGKRISLSELSLALLAIPGVHDAVVLMPDGDAVNARPAALVVAPDLSEAQVLDALAAQLDAAFLPRPLKRVAALPRNAVGKLPRAALLELLHG